MSSQSARLRQRESKYDCVSLAQQILNKEADALRAVARRLEPPSFDAAVELLATCQGRVVVCGMGKAGLVGRKITATLSSTGVPSQFLHPAEAVHGDLGSLRSNDVLLVFSFSGETEELTRLLPSFVQSGIPIIAITAHPHSALGRASRVVLQLGQLEEACHLGLAPSTSTTAMLGLGDALALVVSQRRGFAPEDFVRFHPAGSLGRKLTKVEEVMRPLADCRLARDYETLRQVIARQSRPGRRTGAIMLTDSDGRLTGIFTDSDLARMVGQTRDAQFDLPIEQVMTRQPKVVMAGAALDEALKVLEEYKISELPVLDAQQHPVGMIDVTDLIGLCVPALRRSQDKMLAAPAERSQLKLHRPDSTGGLPQR